MSSASLRVSVPICAFRKPYSREFLETERVPPPSTVFGFLLSLVGEELRAEYAGTRIAIAVTSEPAVSRVLRTVWRVKNKKLPPGTGNNAKPDYQELLTGLEICVWVEEGLLADRIRNSLIRPDEMSRYGGLSLGESRDLVSDVDLDPVWNGVVGTWLVRDPTGDLPLPVWVDHVGSAGTVWRQFRREEGVLKAPGADDPRWIVIEPPPKDGKALPGKARSRRS